MVFIRATSYVSVLIISTKKKKRTLTMRRNWRRERKLQKKWVMEDESKNIINSIS
jgi:hypothetical protein